MCSMIMWANKNASVDIERALKNTGTFVKTLAPNLSSFRLVPVDLFQVSRFSRNAHVFTFALTNALVFR